MEQIGELLGKIDLKPKRGGINSAKALAVENLMRFMREDPKNSQRFRYWLGRTRNLATSKIYWMISSSKDGKNPQALLNYFLKKENEKISVQKQGISTKR